MHLTLLTGLLIVLTLSASPVLAAEIADDDFNETLRDSCVSLWPDDFRRQVGCPDEQRYALQELMRGKPDDVTPMEYDIVVRHCLGPSQFDYNRRMACMRKLYAVLREFKGLSGTSD